MHSSLFDLHGKVAFVSGSSAGLGQAIACGLAQAGATVVLNGRTESTLQAIVTSFRDAGLKAHGEAFDITDSAQISQAVERIESRVGPIDILVNNAGITRRTPLEQAEESAWREVLETNLTAVFLLTRRVVQGMIQRKQGKIINICSLMSEVARPSTALYAASKGGLKMLTKAMTVEWARHNIQINGIGPGYFLTDMTEKLAADPQFDSWIRSRTPAGRWGKPEELVGSAVFLASAASNFVNGQILYVDGGILAAL